MKRNRQAEGERILREAEETLRETLLEILPEVAKSGEALFTNSKFNPQGFASHHISKRAEALLDTSNACIEMRETLGLPLEDSVGQQFLSACEENASFNEHRRGPRKLASALLDKLENGA